MAKVARGALRSPVVVETAALVSERGSNPLERALLIREWIEENVIFTPDPDAVELLRTPEYLLTIIRDQGRAWADCDCVAMLAASLGMAVGRPSRFRLLKFAPNGPWSHVFTELYTPCEGWVEMDTTRPDQFPPGLQVVDTKIHGI